MDIQRIFICALYFTMVFVESLLNNKYIYPILTKAVHVHLSVHQVHHSCQLTGKLALESVRDMKDQSVIQGNPPYPSEKLQTNNIIY